jgi:putative heme-binding domain-containing protein
MISGVATLDAQLPIYNPGEIENGSRLYSANCTGCHGPEGDAIASVNFAAGKYRRASSDEELVRIITRGIPGTAMPPSNFSEGQAGTIVAYLRSMAASASKMSAGDASRGKAVFEGKGQCTTCHSVAGAGSRTGPPLTEIGMLRRAVDLERALLDPSADVRPENRSVRAVTRDGGIVAGRLMNQDTFSIQVLDAKEQLVSLAKANLREYILLANSTMPTYKGKLTAQEVADVVSYLQSLKGRSAN